LLNKVGYNVNHIHGLHNNRIVHQVNFIEPFKTVELNT
jgi:hypothetical protein